MEQNKNSLKALFTRGFSLLLISAFLCISLIALAGMNKTTAWFAWNDEISSDNFSIVAKDTEDVGITLTSYAVSEITDTNSQSKLDNQYTLSTAGISVLPTHDPNNISYSIYKKALVVTIHIEVEAPTTLDISLDTPNDTIPNSEDNMFSNCMQIMRATLDNTSTYATPSSEPMSFVKLNESKITHIPLETISLTEDNLSTTRCYVIEYLDDFSEIFKPSLDMVKINFSNDIHFTVTQHN